MTSATPALDASAVPASGSHDSSGHAGMESHGIPEHIYRRRWVILGALCLSLMIVVIANTSLNVALPKMSESLGLSNSAQQWVIDAYSLVFAGLLFTAGSLGDRWGRKRFLLAGIAVFGVASAYATFFVSTGGELIFARAAMGVGGALVMPATLSILVNTFPAGERAKAIAIWSGIAGGGGALGIVLGGWLVEHFWWGSTFAINIPVAAIALVLCFILLPESRESSHGRIDFVGAALSIAGLVLLVYGLIEGPHWGWTDPQTLAVIAGGIVALALFALWELRTASPMLEVRLFKNATFSVSSIGITLVFLTMFGFFFVVSQLFQLVLGYGPFESGLRMLPIMPFLMIFTPISAVAVARLGVRRVVLPGMVVTAGGITILSQLHAESGYLHVLVGMAVMALGMAFTMTPMTTLIMSSVPPEHAGMGSAMNDTTRELGTTLGVAVLGSILSSGFASQFRDTAATLPDDTRHLAESSLAGARVVSEQIGGEQGTAIFDAAKDAWVNGLEMAMLVGAGIILGAALLTYFLLPNVGKVTATDVDGDGIDDISDVDIDAELEALEPAAVAVD
ncbi:DHA2 family efflux MFS transporter permease subunit [Desertimonas flava]|jgi:EmrB/QacA subfamily drug resistance transporter|uniref:DHA2 family efflux MFS transporter permease subunit n=1 Tax=Desertimonas flava TaxID=2064846 RepID=UPI000E35767E|nr:DHA2 family efflux MFS transporter permease subunit [Desertimonas flava]